jgi:hypothetical protein
VDGVAVLGGAGPVVVVLFTSTWGDETVAEPVLLPVAGGLAAVEVVIVVVEVVVVAGC